MEFNRYDHLGHQDDDGNHLEFEIDHEVTQDDFEIIAGEILTIFEDYPMFNLEITIRVCDPHTDDQGMCEYYSMDEIINMVGLEKKIIRLTMQYMEKLFGVVEFSDTKRAI
jgi:hypothetical protein